MKNTKVYFIIISIIVISAFTGCSVSPRYNSNSLPSGVKVLEEEYGVASYYADKFHGRKTASGEVFDMNKISAAHKEMPLGTVVRVTNLKNGRWVVLKINDRGPFVKGRIIDLSYGAAKQLDFVREGTTDVRIEVLKWGVQ